MEKSACATNVTPNNHIPEELSFSILSKLPIKSLKRFGCVRKSWAILFENLYFLNMYQNYFISNNHSYYDGTSIILHHVNDPLPGEDIETTLYLVLGERCENLIKLDWPKPLHKDVWFDEILSNAHGILCLANDFYLNKHSVLWNPTTNECKVIPLSPFTSQLPNMEFLVLIHAFGYDHVRDDYKFIRRVSFYEWNDNPAIPYEEPIHVSDMWEIYSLRRNSWKKLEANTNIQKAWDKLYMDGMCHWWYIKHDYDTNIYELLLVSFDLCNEVFLTMPVLVDTVEPSDIYHLTSLNGAISFITYDKTTTFHITILGELGVKESWTKVFIVKPIPYFERIIGVGKKGVIFFVTYDDELVWFDLSTRMIGELGIKGHKYHCHIVSNEENFLPIESL